jgi:hypothetical protein
MLGLVLGFLTWLFVGIDVSGKPLEFQINCNVNNTECHVSGEDTQGNYYGLMAVNYSPDGNAFDYTLSKGNCTILKTNDMEWHNTQVPEEQRYGRLGDMQVKYSYDVICYSMGKLSLKELLPK